MKKPFKLNRRSFVKTTILGTLGTITVPEFLESCTGSASKEDSLAGKKNPGTAALNNTLMDNTRHTVCATFETQGEVQIATGIGHETVSVKVASDAKDIADPVISWRYKNPAEADPEKFDFQGTITVGGRESPGFGWTDKVLEWTDYYRYLRDETPLSKRKFLITIETQGGFRRLLVNGMLMHEWPKQKSMDEAALQVSTLGGAVVTGNPETIVMSACDERFWPMDISSRFNAREIAGDGIQVESLPPCNVPFRVNGVPFIVGTAAWNDNNHVDIGQSWFRVGNLFGNQEAPNAGSFDGRWMGVHADSPTRIQFRLPNRAPKTIHLLAVADGSENAVPRLTAQFYRVAAGFPVSVVSPEVPSAKAKADPKRCHPIRTASGKTLHLWQVAIPVNPGLLQQLSCHDEPDRRYDRSNRLTNSDMLEVELTKDVSIYRMYPDHCYYSAHGAGLPSAVRLFAATIEYPEVEARFTPDAYGNIWIEPAVPSYTVSLVNRTNRAVSAKLRIDTLSHSGTEKLKKSMRVKLASLEARDVAMQTPVTRFGHHDLTLRVTTDKEEVVLKRSLSYLRKREHEARRFDARGFMFGYWAWQGAHGTPNADEEIRLMGPLGMESMQKRVLEASGKGLADMERFGMKNFWACPAHIPFRGLDGIREEYLNDPEKVKEDVRAATTRFLETQARNPAIAEPTFMSFWAEPGGIGTHGTLPEFYGEAQGMTQQERAVFDLYRHATLEIAKVLREVKPDIKLLIPWGDICFSIPFLKENDALTEMMDGVAVDFGLFDRLPEMQFHQSNLHRCYQFKTYWDKYKPGVKAVLPSIEGPCVGPVRAGSLTPQEAADSTIRAALMLAGYGVTRQFAICSPVESSDYWGEQHYGGGAISRLPELNPHISYSAMGTLFRHFRWMEFIGWKPTGSLTVFCHHYCDSRSRKDLFVLWTVRGKREVTMTVPPEAKPELYDSMDNTVPLKVRDGKVGFTIGQSPIFLYGPTEAASIALGAPDHSDAAPGAHTMSLGYMANLLRQDTSPNLVDYHYTNSFPAAIRRFPAEMKVERVTASRDGKVTFPALSIELPPQPKDRGVMPFFSTFVLDKPVEIPGKSSHLSLWVRGASDWGRVVYVLRDAKGENWISVGSIGAWNCDDMPCNSYFNFDGWRLLRFEMPSHAPYDRFREAGTYYWGSTGNGDRVVDLPLKLEKVYVERRPKAMYVNTLEPADPAPVLLGELIAEYASPDEMGAEAIRRDRLSMPSPKAGFKRSNPIVVLEQKGELKPTRITQVALPAFEPDGTRGVFHFDRVAGATSYDIWIGTEPDGLSAFHLGKNIKSSEVTVRGVRPNCDLYAFIVYRDANGRTSKPSQPFKFRLESQFGNR